MSNPAMEVPAFHVFHVGAAPVIRQGYSKDHRPDLPQIKIGMGATPEGIPVYGQVLDGNQDDKTWNLKACP